MSGVVERPSRMSDTGRESLPDVREWSGGNPRCLGVVGRTSWMSESSWEALTASWEAFTDVQEWSGGYHRWSGGPSGCPGVVRRPSRKFRSGWAALLDVREWSRGPFRMSECGREALPEVWEWSGGSPGCPGVVRRPSWMSGSGREALKGGQKALTGGRDVLSDDRELSEGPPECREW